MPTYVSTKPTLVETQGRVPAPSIAVPTSTLPTIATTSCSGPVTPFPMVPPISTLKAVVTGQSTVPTNIFQPTIRRHSGDAASIDPTKMQIPSSVPVTTPSSTPHQPPGSSLVTRPSVVGHDPSSSTAIPSATIIRQPTAELVMHLADLLD